MRRVDCCFEVLCSRSIAPDPREEPLHDPAPRVNSEADLIGFTSTPSHSTPLETASKDASATTVLNVDLIWAVLIPGRNVTAPNRKVPLYDG